MRNSGDQPTKAPANVDYARTEEVFGFKLRGFEEQVVSVVGHYVELVKAAKQ